MSFDFQKQLKVGQEGEAKFLEDYAGQVIRLDGRKGDFQLVSNEERVELKCDTYKEAVNYFIERYSVFEKKIAGGPWQARRHGAAWFVYKFINEPNYAWFPVDNLCTYLGRYIDTQGLKEVVVRNRGYTTVGYKIPRTALLHMQVQFIQTPKSPIVRVDTPLIPWEESPLELTGEDE